MSSTTGDIMAGREALSKAPFFRDAKNELQMELIHPREAPEIAQRRLPSIAEPERLLRAATWVVRWNSTWVISLRCGNWALEPSNKDCVFDVPASWNAQEPGLFWLVTVMNVEPIVIVPFKCLRQ